MLQVADVHEGVPLVALHTVLQLPQCVGSVAKFVSQPLAALPSQLPNDGPHAMPHTPRLQFGVPFTELHALPQNPQCELLV